MKDGLWKLIEMLLESGKSHKEIFEQFPDLSKGDFYKRFNRAKIQNYKKDPKNLRFHTEHYQKWRKAALERDGCCVLCGSESNLQVDHIKPASVYPELKYKLENSRTLCGNCHRKRTTTYGRAGIRDYVKNKEKK